MTISTISTLPAAPARTDAPATFISKADAFLAALVTMQGELNTSIGQMNTDIAQANTDATNAATSASNAATSASNASTSESNASTSASNASTSASNAATSASDAAASYDSFDDRYLGAKASDPTLDNDGDALITGAIYFNTTSGVMRVYTGSAWQDTATVTTTVTTSQISDLAANVGTFLTTPSSANLASAVTDETGSGALVFGTSPALTSPSLTGTILEDVYAWATTTGANTTDLDPDNGSIHTVTLTGNITSLTDNLSAGEAITLMIDDGTAYTITWPTITWVNNGGAAPTLATTGYTVIALWKVSTTLYGALVGDGS